MDNARALTIAGIALACAAVFGLFLVLTGGDDAVVVLPEERTSMPTAPSQSPDRALTAPPVADAFDPLAEADPAETLPTDDAAPADDPTPEDLLADIEATAGTSPAEDVVGPTEPPAVPDAASPPALGTPTDLAAGEPIVFCFPGVIPPPLGDCADRDIVLGLATETIGVRGPDGETEALSVELADPSGLSAARTAQTCEQYASLKANDWGPLTTVAMRRDREMNRFCGLIALARQASPGRGGLEALSEDLLEAMPDDQWPTIGEAEVTNPIVLDTPGDPRVWFVQADRVEFTVRDVAAADFDGDGANEVLVFTALQAADGTAVGGGYALAERAGGTLRLAPVDPY